MIWFCFLRPPALIDLMMLLKFDEAFENLVWFSSKSAQMCPKLVFPGPFWSVLVWYLLVDEGPVEFIN